MQLLSNRFKSVTSVLRPCLVCFLFQVFFYFFQFVGALQTFPGTFLVSFSTILLLSSCFSLHIVVSVFFSSTLRALSYFLFGSDCPMPSSEEIPWSYQASCKEAAEAIGNCVKEVRVGCSWSMMISGWPWRIHLAAPGKSAANQEQSVWW